MGKLAQVERPALATFNTDPKREWLKRIGIYLISGEKGDKKKGIPGMAKPLKDIQAQVSMTAVASLSLLIRKWLLQFQSSHVHSRQGKEKDKDKAVN